MGTSHTSVESFRHLRAPGLVMVLAMCAAAAAACGDPPTAPGPPEVTVLSVTGVSPATGSTLGNSFVTVSGTGFDRGAAATVDGVSTRVTFVNSTTLYLATMPAHAAGRVDIVVTNPSGPAASAPGGFTYVEPARTVFMDSASGFTTTALHDAQDEVVEFADGHLIWSETGTAFSGYSLLSTPAGIVIDAARLCACWFEIRFGIRDGEPHAYVTADYGHDNPGTVVDLEVEDGRLVARRSSVYPPGTYTLSGFVTEMTPTGPVAVEGAYVAFSLPHWSGWQSVITDRNGLYEIPGLYNGRATVAAGRSGYANFETNLSMTGDTRFDVQLVRR